MDGAINTLFLMKLKLGTNDIFDCPPGQYSAVLEFVGEPNKRIKKPCAQQVRLRFRVYAESGKEYLVGVTYCADLSYGSELYEFLNSWLEGDFESVLDEHGEVELDQLLMRRADLVVIQKDLGTHTKPLVCIGGIFPKGTLMKQKSDQGPRRLGDEPIPAQGLN
jgi:hypothetical protein